VTPTGSVVNTVSEIFRYAVVNNWILTSSPALATVTFTFTSAQSLPQGFGYGTTDDASGVEVEVGR